MYIGDIMIRQEGVIIEKVQPDGKRLKGTWIKPRRQQLNKQKQAEDYAHVLNDLHIDRCTQ
jgi:hypothetical protein